MGFVSKMLCLKINDHFTFSRVSRVMSTAAVSSSSIYLSNKQMAARGDAQVSLFIFLSVDHANTCRVLSYLVKLCINDSRNGSCSRYL